jgi:uncharacterized protein YeeX (DUF496 family)
MIQITIHRALAKIKTTEKRIQSLLRDGVFVSSVVGQTQVTPSGRSVKDVSAEIRSNYDSVVSLLDNYEALKLAVIRSNSGITKETSGLEETKIGDRDMLVAEIIAKQKYAMPLRKAFISTLAEQLNKVSREIERVNARVHDNLPNVLSNIANGSKETLSEAQVSSITETYYQNNSCFIVDPLKLQETIKKHQKEYDEFMDEADSRLSEVNALKLIEVSLNE